MQFGSRRIVPLVSLLFSLLYLAFGFSLEKLTMIGDEQGWDPGSRALPIGVGFMMLGLSVYLVYRESARREAEKPVPAGPRRLILLNIAVSILFILAFRGLGFILSTHILLFTLIYFNHCQDVSGRLLPPFFAGLIPSSAFVLLLYSAGRLITRGLFYLGRSRGAELLENRAFASLVVFIFLALLFLILFTSLRRALRNPGFRVLLVSGLVAAGTTELLFLVFRQIFFVNLARGIIFW